MLTSASFICVDQRLTYRLFVIPSFSVLLFRLDTREQEDPAKWSVATEYQHKLVIINTFNVESFARIIKNTSVTT